MILSMINWWAILVSGVFVFVLGGIWFGFLFSKPWLAAMGINLEDIADASMAKPPAYIVSAIAGFVLSLVLALFVTWMDLRTFTSGAGVGALAWLGFNFTSFVKLLFWEDRPWTLVLIDAGYDLSSFTIAGGILSAWR